MLLTTHVTFIHIAFSIPISIVVCESILHSTPSLVTPEVCEDLVRSLGKDYRVYSIQSKDSNRTAREIVLSAISDGAALPTVTDIIKEATIVS